MEGKEGIRMNLIDTLSVAFFEAGLVVGSEREFGER